MKFETKMTNGPDSAPKKQAERWEDEFWGSGPANEANELHEGPADRQRPYDLGERTAQFGEEIIRFARKIPQNPVNNRLIAQLVGAGTSVGGNYCEADDAVTKKEFRKNIGTCQKESKETKHWLRMIAAAEPSMKESARPLWQEAKELHLIFCAIHRK